MESLAYLPNLIALLGVMAVLAWQSINMTAYERTRTKTCEEKLAAKDVTLATKDATIQTLTIEKERLELLVMGAGVRISGGTNTIGRDLTGGDHAENK